MLAVAITVIHRKDQGGLTALKDPAYVGQGYRVLELAGLVSAVLLVINWRPVWAWLLRRRGVSAGMLPRG